MLNIKSTCSGWLKLICLLLVNETLNAQFLGAKKWEFLTGDSVGSSPAIGSDGTVYVGSSDYSVYALYGTTGAKKWEFKTGLWVGSSPAIGSDGTVYVGSYDKKVYALNGATGAKKWEYLTGGMVVPRYFQWERGGLTPTG
jgi:outer membrane protein assembly factor BamB